MIYVSTVVLTLMVTLSVDAEMATYLVRIREAVQVEYYIDTYNVVHAIVLYLPMTLYICNMARCHIFLT